MHSIGGPPVATMHGPGGPSVAAVHGPGGQVTAQTTYDVTDQRHNPKLQLLNVDNTAHVRQTIFDSLYIFSGRVTYTCRPEVRLISTPLCTDQTSRL